MNLKHLEKKLISFLIGKYGSKVLDIHTTLNGNDIKLPIIGLGTLKIHEDSIESSLTTAIKSGYRHIDTAYLHYNEGAIGKVLEGIMKKSEIKREDLFITSKLPHFGMTPEDVKTYVYRSLYNLRLTYLDLYLIQFPVGLISLGPTSPILDPFPDHVGVWRALEELVDEGTVRNIGLSNFTKPQISRILQYSSVPPSNVQVEMHVFCQQRELRGFCEDHDITVTAYAPLGSPGLLHYMRETKTKEKVVNPSVTPLNNLTVNHMAKIKQKTPAQILLRFLLQQGVAVIPKSSNPQHIQSNIDVFSFELSENEMSELRSLDKGEKGRIYGHEVWTGLNAHPQFPFSSPKTPHN